MNFNIHRINDYIVQIHDDVDVETSCQNSIDKILKRCRNIDEIERKYVVFEMFVSSSKRRFLFVFILDTQSMIDNNQIDINIFDDSVESI